MIIYRERTCLDCKYEWHREVEYSRYTFNLSGEKSVFCPKCNSRNVMSGPHKQRNRTLEEIHEETVKRLPYLFKTTKES